MHTLVRAFNILALVHRFPKTDDLEGVRMGMRCLFHRLAILEEAEWRDRATADGRVDDRG